MVPRPIASGTSLSAGGAGRRVVVGISGASGAIYGIRALELLHGAAVETHLVVTAGGRKTITFETDYLLSDVYAMADFVYKPGDLSAAIASGSFLVDGMLVAPCSVKTLSAIASSYDNNLLVRAADVMLKERRPLVLMVRETPLSYTHLRLMSEATLAGAIIAPPVPALDAINVPVAQTKRWTGVPSTLLLEVVADPVCRPAGPPACLASPSAPQTHRGWRIDASRDHGARFRHRPWHRLASAGSEPRAKRRLLAALLISRQLPGGPR